MGFWANIGITAGAILIRNIAGWIENAFKDGRVSKYELKQLGATIFRVGLITAGLSYGLSLDTMSAASTGVVLDMILTKIGSVAKKKR